MAARRTFRLLCACCGTARHGTRVICAALKNSRDLSRDGFRDAVEKARLADVVLLFLGEEQILSGEAHSPGFSRSAGRAGGSRRGDREARTSHRDDHSRGAALDVSSNRGQSKRFFTPGIREPWVDLPSPTCFGDAVPSGKLTMTFPRTVGQVPIYMRICHRTSRVGERIGIPWGIR